MGSTAPPGPVRECPEARDPEPLSGATPALRLRSKWDPKEAGRVYHPQESQRINPDPHLLDCPHNVAAQPELKTRRYSTANTVLPTATSLVPDKDSDLGFSLESTTTLATPLSNELESLNSVNY